MDTIFNISPLAIKIGAINAHTGELTRSKAMQHQDALQRKLPERIFHAVCFEGIATAILAPTAAWLMQRSVVEMGGLTIILATTAMLWNIIYNFGFDRFWPVQRVKRTAKVRALHAMGFECGFIVIGVSIVAAVLGVTLLQAFTLEIGFFLFFLPYTMFYNWAYDTLREKFLKRRQQRRVLAG